jgi:hypothetical protein
MSSVVVLLMYTLVSVVRPGESSCLAAPVTYPISARFVAPSCPYCAGHRTLDFAAMPGIEVVAPVDGTVTFAGTVAGTAYITMSLPSQSRRESNDAEPGESDVVDSGDSAYLVTLGGVIADRGVMAGAIVAAGQRIGVASGERVRLSLRRTVPGGEAAYLDPEPSLVGWRAPARLIPPPGSAARRVVTRFWACRAPL